MKGGRKLTPPSTKAARGTLKPCIDGARVELEASGDLPQMPDWLSPAGQTVWAELLPHAAMTRLATAGDAELFGTACQLHASIIQCWKAGDVPPAAHLVECRRLFELFGLAGAKSRVLAGGVAKSPRVNPFAHNGRRAGAGLRNSP